MELSNRLKKILEIIPTCDTVADVGTDHGYIPICCVQTGKCKSAIAMDIKKGPLDAAKGHIQKYGLGNKIETRLGAGVENLKNDEADVIVIAGMGGPTIEQIIKDGMDVITQNTTLILQPMIAQKELREFLYKFGFDISDEYVLSEQNKFYNIMVVKKGDYIPNDKDIYIGKNLKENSPEDFKKYIDYKINVLTKIIKGLESSRNDVTEELYRAKKELEVYKSEN